MILHAFEQWGIDCVHRFRGMFAIAIWDARAQAALARARPDRRQAALLQRPPRPDHVRLRDQGPARGSASSARGDQREALYHYLSFLTTPGARDAVRRHPEAAARARGCGSTPTAAITRAVLGRLDHARRSTDAARTRSRSDPRRAADGGQAPQGQRRPVGVFLSGGIDSSTNAALFSEGEGGRCKTFSIGYDGDVRSYQNELPTRADGGARRRRPSRAPAHASTTPRFAADGWCGSRTSRSPIRSAFRCITSSELARDDGVDGLPGRRRRRRTFWGYPSGCEALRRQQLERLARCRAPIKRLGSPACARWATTARPPRVAAPRRAGRAGVLGRRRGLHRSAEAATAVAASAAELEGVTSWDVLGPIAQRFQGRPGSHRTLNWMTTSISACACRSCC